MLKKDDAVYTRGSIQGTMLKTGCAMLAGTLAMSGYNIADTYFVGQLGKSPLAVAIENAQKFPEMAALFESRLKSVDESGYDGETAMMLYAAAGNDTGFQQYVSKGGDIFKGASIFKELPKLNAWLLCKIPICATYCFMGICRGQLRFGLLFC